MKTSLIDKGGNQTESRLSKKMLGLASLLVLVSMALGMLIQNKEVEYDAGLE